MCRELDFKAETPRNARLHVTNQRRRTKKMHAVYINSNPLLLSLTEMGRYDEGINGKACCARAALWHLAMCRIAQPSPPLQHSLQHTSSAHTIND